MPPGSASPQFAADTSPITRAARLARAASRQLSVLSTGAKNDTLLDLADSLINEADTILEANETDLAEARRARLTRAQLDHLELSRQRLGHAAEGVRAVAALTDPVGEVLRGSRRPNGLLMYEMRVPIGVVAMIYENRPLLTIDAVSLCLKSSNAAVLMGGGADSHTNAAIHDVVRKVLTRQNISPNAVQLLRDSSDEAINEMIHLRDLIDVLIPRGSTEMTRRVCSTATVPTIEVGPGKCHIFISRSARVQMASDIVMNAKVQRPAASNSVDTLLIERPIASELLELLAPRLQAAGVRICGCPATCAAIPGAAAAVESDWSEEFLNLSLAMRIVESPEHAIAHINRYGSHHSEAIITEDYSAGRRFCEAVDAAAVYVNASTRFTDGFEFGQGAELGISTQKLHRRGPIGLRALTTWKWVIQGQGQVRD